MKSCLAGWSVFSLSSRSRRCSTQRAVSLCPFGFLISPSLFMEDYTAGTIDPALLFVVVGGALARRRIDAAEHNLPYQHPPNTPSSEELFEMAEKTLWTRSVRYLGDKVLSTIQALVLLGACVLSIAAAALFIEQNNAQTRLLLAPPEAAQAYLEYRHGRLCSVRSL